MSKLSIVMPVYFNEETLASLYENLKQTVLPRLPDYEIVMVDEGSQDGSWEEMNRIAAADERVRLLKLSRNFGSHAAILAGLSVCTGDCAAVKTADGQEPPELLLQMYESWTKGNKVVLAVRADRRDGAANKAFANLYYRLVRRLAVPNMPKGGFDCYLIDRKVIEVLKLLDEPNSAVTLQILWAGFRTDTVSYVRRKREQGKSRWTFSKKIKLLADSLVGFSYIPIRAASVIGSLLFLGAVIWGLVVLFGRLFGNIPIQGFSALMIVVLLSAGLILLMLGILGEYIWRTLDVTRHRPVFIIDEARIIEKSNLKE